MRLLHTETLELRDFLDNEIPRYAILSHAWEEEEVLFQDMTAIRTAKKKYGFRKLEGACQLARSQFYKYIWIDTCCIDKTSSAELTEAINSMFRWYKEAAVCYAYLSDVGVKLLTPVGDQVYRQASLSLQVDEMLRDMRKSRWFTRGWTLQELIAPPNLEFYSRTWHRLGNKKDAKIHALVSDITGIDVHNLCGGDPSEVSIARRMFWASRRQTTRLEDRAYSLLGLFDVNMPLIYGEGKKAFRRLQEEILRTSDDYSIFAWHNSDYAEGTAVDVLAISPSDFAESGALSRQPFFRVGREATTITSQGISCQLPLMSVAGLDTNDFQPFTEVEAILDCQLGSIPGTFPTIRLRSLPSNGQHLPKHYYRMMTEEMTKFVGNTIPGLLGDSDILGLDPTQLHKDGYKATLDKEYLRWNLASIVFTRRVPASPHPEDKYAGIPWSLSLLNDDYAPDCTGFWLLNFGTSKAGTFHRDMKYEVNVAHADPHESWDASSMQLRVPRIPPHLYGIGEFKIVDGVFNIEVTLTNEVERTLRSISQFRNVVLNTSLIVGRQAGSRRVAPQPWCHFLQGGAISCADHEVKHSRWKPEDKLSEWGSGKSVLKNGGICVEATVRTKEISGVFHHVVAIRVTGVWGQEEEGLYLLTDGVVERSGSKGL